MKNNYFETSYNFTTGKFLSITFVLFGKLHQINWKDNEFFWCSIKSFLSEQEEKIISNHGIVKDEKELIELRNLILSKI